MPGFPWKACTSAHPELESPASRPHAQRRARMADGFALAGARTPPDARLPMEGLHGHRQDCKAMTAPAPTALSRPLLSAGLHRRAHRRPGTTARVRQLLLRLAQHHRHWHPPPEGRCTPQLLTAAARLLAPRLDKEGEHTAHSHGISGRAYMTGLHKDGEETGRTAIPTALPSGLERENRPSHSFAPTSRLTDRLSCMFVPPCNSHSRTGLHRIAPRASNQTR